MIRQLLFFSIAGLIACFLSYDKATGQEYSWEYYSVADGLPQTQIYNLFQDSKGFIWISTKGGVSKFDGIEFENYTSKDGLRYDFVTSVQEDEKGTIYIGTKMGVDMLDQGIIKPIIINNNQTYKSLNLDNINGMWINSQGRKLEYYLNGKLVVEHPFLDLIKKGEQIIRIIINPSNKDLLFETLKNQLFIWDGLRRKSVKKSVNTISTIYGTNGELFGITSDSLYVYESEDFRPLLSLEDGLMVRLICSRKDIYFTDRKGISSLFHFNGEKVTKFHQNFNFIMNVLVDDEENLWVGTESGLWRLQSRGFQNFLADRDDNFYTWTVLQDNKNNYWFGSFLHGLKKFDGKNFTDYPVDHLFKNNGFQYFYSGGIKDKNGDLLFSAYRGVIKYDGRKFNWFYHDKQETIVYIYEDSLNEKLYFSSAQNGIIEIDSQQKIRCYDDRENKENTGLVTSIVNDKYNRLWICGNLGISIRENDTWRNLPDSQDSITIGAISMVKDLNDNLWLGSNSGLYFYDYQQLRQVAPKVFDGQIGVLNFAKSGELLIGSIKGIGLLDLEKFYTKGEESVRYFNSKSGFFGTECKHNSSFKDNEGNIWICTSDRVVKVNTDELKSNPYPPRVYIKSISTLSDKMEWLPVDKEIIEKKTYSFSPSNDDLRFNYHGISHSAPTGVVYQTMLDGYDAEWSAFSKERYRTYTNLPKGDYTFKVKAANIDGVCTDKIANIQLIIEPAWHEILPVRLGGLAGLLCVAGGIGFLYSGFRRRTKARTEQNEKRIARLQFKSLQGLIDPHFTFNAINSIASMVYKENRDEAYHYFTKFSKLIRTAFDNSEHTTRTIKEELAFVSDYLDIEKMRFKDRFDYSIKIDRNINHDWKIPKMIIQIYVENAVKHGLVSKKSGGQLYVLLKIKSNQLVIEVNDNGVGRKKSGMVKNKPGSLGKGTKIFDSYFDLLNRFNTEKIKAKVLDILDDDGNPAGTQVLIFIPLNYKYNL